MFKMPCAPARSNGETAPTVHTRSSRPCESRLICTASSTTCSKITPASSTSDLCREGMPAIVLRSPFSDPIHLGETVCNLELEMANFSVDADMTKQPEIAQHFSRTQHHRSQRVIRNRNRQTCLFAYTFIQIFQQ